MSDADPRAAALVQTREHGLWGRADSPPDWQAALDGATPGDPVLVRSPDDRRDDFFLVPMRPGKPAARSAWVILDRDTLKLREASLLDHWPAPAFPDEKDRNRLSHTPLVLPDGTRARFRPEELRPNLKNLVWKPTEAAVLPYWPVKEFIAAHPLTREPVSIYLTQDGHILTDLDHGEPQTPSATPAVGKRRVPAAVLALLILSAALVAVAFHFGKSETPLEPAPLAKTKPVPAPAPPDAESEVKADEGTSSRDQGDLPTDAERKLLDQIEALLDPSGPPDKRDPIRREIRARLGALRDEKARLAFLHDCLRKLRGVRSLPPDAEPAPPKPSR